jgi:hypothetical protein
MRVIIRGILFPAGGMMDLDARLQEATRQAIEAAGKIDKAKWADGADWADNPAIFTLARHLEAIAHDLDADDLEPYVLAFWSATKDPADWDEALEQFLDVWDHHKARLPVGNLATIAGERARNKPDLGWARDYRPPIRFLIRICVELARMRRDYGHFKLSQRDAAKIIGCTQPNAGRMLHRLCRDGVLLVKDKPPQGCEKAIKYRLMLPYPD